MSKTSKFIPAIPLPNGKKLATLEDAALYIQNLPKAEFAKDYWQFAGRQVVAAINGESNEMLARIAFMRALAGKAPGKADAPPPRDPSKDKHEIRGYKKRNPWR